MEEALDELSKMGLKLAVFSNKPDEFAGKLCRTLFGERFELIAGNRAGIPVKPDPTGLFLALEKLESNRKNVFIAEIPALIWTPERMRESPPSGWNGDFAPARSWKSTMRAM